MNNIRKEEEAKEELRRLVILGSLGATNNTSKLPRTNKLNFDVKTVVDSVGYELYPKGTYGEEYVKNKENKLSRYDFKKHARQLLNTSDVDQMVTLQKLQNDRLDKIEDIERSLKVDDQSGYIDGASYLTNLNTRINNDPFAANPRSQKAKFYGAKSELISDMKRFNNSVDSRRKSDHSLMNLRFEPKNISGGRHMDDPFIYGLGL